MSPTFMLHGRTWPYLDHPYNRTRSNERAVEVPVALHVLGGARRALEVGAVLPHYLPAWPQRHHTVIDLEERYAGVTSADVLAWEPADEYDTIVSISTLEHLRSADDVLAAVDRMKSWLKRNGRLFLTVPHGCHPSHPHTVAEMDELVRTNALGMAATLRMDKVDPGKHLWVERSLSEPPLPYGRPTKHAHTVYLMFYSKGGKWWR